MAVYILDSNFFISAYRAYYPLDVAVGFWSKLKEMATDGRVISIEKVRDEIYHYEDDLKHWCVDNLPANFFNIVDTRVLREYGRVSQWAISNGGRFNNRLYKSFYKMVKLMPFL